MTAIRVGYAIYLKDSKIIVSGQICRSRRSSIAMVMLMALFFAGMSFPNVSASEVVMTDAIEATPDGAFMTGWFADADSQGNTHFV